jgi:hypothetical protein
MRGYNNLNVPTLQQIIKGRAFNLINAWLAERWQ